MIEIPLTQGKVALVDDDDYEWLNRWKWHYSHGYAMRLSRGKKIRDHIYMHREILNPPNGMETDHINHNGCDNRRSNLRICTQSQNGANRLMRCNNPSGKKGVSWGKSNRKWQSQITFHNKHIHLGYYDTIDKAFEVYKKKSIELFGEFANYD